MDLKEIQSLISRFEKSQVRFLELELEGLKLKLSKDPYGEVHNLSEPKRSIIDDDDLKTKQQTQGFLVKSPLVGTFYSSPSPQDDPFVLQGQEVVKGQTLCIIEAMKIMNEITAPVSGVVKSINVKNGSAVGYDQVLMEIV